MEGSLPKGKMGVSKNNGTPKWMVYIMENPIKMDDLGVPLFLEMTSQGYLKSFHLGNDESRCHSSSLDHILGPRRIMIAMYSP